MDEQRVQEIQEAAMRWKTNDQLEKIAGSRSKRQPEVIAAAKLELEQREAGLREEPEFWNTEAGYRIKIAIAIFVILIIFLIIVYMVIPWLLSDILNY